MKASQSSLLFLAKTLPIGAVYLLTAPTAGLAQVQSATRSAAAETVVVDTIVVPAQSATSNPSPQSVGSTVAAPPTAIAQPATNLSPVVVPSPSSAPTNAPSTLASPNVPVNPGSTSAVAPIPGSTATVATGSGSTAAIVPVANPSPTATSQFPGANSVPVLMPTGAYPQPQPIVPTGAYPQPTYGYPAPIPYPVATPYPSGSQPNVSVQVNVNGAGPTTYPAYPGYPGGAQVAYPQGYPVQPVYPQNVPGQPIYGVTAPPGTYPGGYPVYPSQGGTPIATPNYGQPTMTQPNFTQPNLQLANPVSGDLAFQRLAEADRLYQAGQLAMAESLYRQVKSPLTAATATPKSEAITNPALLPLDGQSAWQQVSTALSQRQTTQAIDALRAIVRSYPQFVPAQVQLAQALDGAGRRDEAIAILEQAATLYPTQTDLVRSQINALSKANRWMEAGIAARQFALLNPTSAQATEFNTLADQAMQRARSATQRKVTGNAIGGLLTGGLNYLLTGKVAAPINAAQNTWNLLQGESTIGSRMAQDLLSQVQTISDPEVVNYVNDIGQRLARVAGRRDLSYEFHVINDRDVNASALPGGKIFVNAGAIASANSEAEFAGFLARQLAHSVLSHPFQLLAKDSFTSSLGQLATGNLERLLNRSNASNSSGNSGNLLNQLLPGALSQLLPNANDAIGDLLKSNYTQQMERQADVLGTRILAASGYAADGLRNLVRRQGGSNSTATSSGLNLGALLGNSGGSDRLRDLETTIVQAGLNPYAYEGVERHAQIKARIVPLLNGSSWAGVRW
jgi:predicted Zn-dependent protease